MSNHPLYRDPSLRRLVNEYLVIRESNAAARSGEHARGEAAFAEGALLLVAIERFLRVLLGASATPGQTLFGLLDLAMGDRLDLLDPPIYLPHMSSTENRAFANRVIRSVRNPLLHGNYEQAATVCQPGASAEEYFSSGAYRRDLEDAHRFFESMIVQFDENGARVEATRRRNELSQ